MTLQEKISRALQIGPLNMIEIRLNEVIIQHINQCIIDRIGIARVIGSIGDKLSQKPGAKIIDRAKFFNHKIKFFAVKKCFKLGLFNIPVKIMFYQWWQLLQCP